MALLRDFKQQGKTFKNSLLLSVYGVQVVMGIIYFVRLCATGNYY